ncbi:pilus assembly protein PilM [candidate division KSB1 bacterium]|nr:pilus assembly protein PilM [candidate division KSB1 bacterium]
MANESIKLGISFEHDAIRLIEAEEWNGKLNLTSIVLLTLPKTFDFAVIGDDEYVPQIATLLDKSLDNFSSAISNARVCIDRRLALKKTIPLDKGLSQKDILTHVEWELEQLLIAPRDEYNVDYHHVSLANSKKDVVVFAAIRKPVVHFMQDIFKKSRLSLESLDLDLFASIRALQFAASEDLSGANALIEFSRSGVGMALLIDGMYAMSAELPATIENERFDALSAESLSSAINTELQKLVEYAEENFRMIELQRAFFCGNMPNRTIMDEFQKHRSDVAVSVVEPFQHVHRQLNVESQMLIDNQGERFISCFGMVL